MSNTQTPASGGMPAAPGGSDNGAWRTRLADLLDDVTVTAAPGVGAAPPPVPAAAPGSPAANKSPLGETQGPGSSPGGIGSQGRDRQPTTDKAPWQDAPPPEPYEPPAWAIREPAPPREPPQPTPGTPAPAASAPTGGPPAPAPAAAVRREAGPDSPGAMPGEARPPAPNNQLISIRGRSDGLAIEIGKGSWPDIMAALLERLEQSASFFRSARIALDVGPRPVLEDELQQLLALVHSYEMSLGAVRTSAERTFQSALALGLTVTLESAEGLAVADATPATTNVTTAAYFVYRGYLRSGHKLRRQEHVLVIGDVNPGAEVLSDGDILVWGRLRGLAHAGCSGNRRAIVAALDLEPTQLRIADVVSIGPDPKMGQPGKWFWRRSSTKRPEIARIVNQAIMLDEWDATRPGGLVSLRRGGV